MDQIKFLLLLNIFLIFNSGGVKVAFKHNHGDLKFR